MVVSWSVRPDRPFCCRLSNFMIKLFFQLRNFLLSHFFFNRWASLNKAATTCRPFLSLSDSSARPRLVCDTVLVNPAGPSKAVALAPT